MLMAASSLEPASLARVLIDPEIAQQPSVAQHLWSGDGFCARGSGSGIPAIASSSQLCGPGELSWPGNNVRAKGRFWRHFFVDPTVWWDHVDDPKPVEASDCRGTALKGVLWFSNLRKPVRVIEQLDVDLGLVASTLNSTSFDDYSPRRVVGYESEIISDALSKLCEDGQVSEAVDALSVLVQTKSRTSRSLFYCILKCCVAKKDLGLGRRVHELMVKVGYDSNAFLANHLLRMYASHSRLQEAKEVFTKVAKPDSFSWAAVIAVHAKHGEPKEAIRLYEQFRGSDVKPAVHVFVAALQACARATDLESGKQVHSDVLESGIEPDLFVWNCLVDMYAKCGRVGDARDLFDSLLTKDVVTWNAMMGAYAHHERGKEALSLYAEMEREGKVVPNHVTFACLLKACAKGGALEQGKQLHSHIVERGLDGDVLVANCLVDMYAKFGKLDEAREVFDRLGKRDMVTCNTMIAGYAKHGQLEEAQKVFDSLCTKDVVTWTAMIAGYAEHGRGQEALAFYYRMEQEGVILANTYTFACLLKACASMAALQQGRELHAKIVERGLESDTLVGTCLIDMYAKCGMLEDAHKVFDNLPRKDVVTWNAMINGFGQSNEGHMAIECFEEMMRHGVPARESTYTCLLVACSHEGLVEKGQQVYDAMVAERGMVPTIEHNTCMVDLLGRAGYLDEAEKMLLSFESNYVGLMSLLTACRSHGDIERGARCFESLIQLDSKNASAYVLMGKIYADAGMWSDVDKIEKLRKAAGASKKAAVAGIEVNRHIHSFVVGAETGGMSAKLRAVNAKLRDEGGHVPHTELVLKQASKEEKEDELCGHAEKLALAYGLLNTPDGTTLLVTKNLRMCGDCHSATEIMSRVESRSIIVRDAHRVHRFIDGACRCGGVA